MLAFLKDYIVFAEKDGELNKTILRQHQGMPRFIDFGGKAREFSKLDEQALDSYSFEQ